MKRTQRRGSINPIAVLMLLAAIAGGWWLFTYLPVYWDNLTVREAASACAVNYLAGGEEGVKTRLLTRLNETTMDGTVGWHFETDDDGLEVRKPGLGVTEDQVTISFDERKRTLTVHVEYDRVVELKPSIQRKIVHFSVEKTTQL
jgi:hypothetical protein